MQIKAFLQIPIHENETRTCQLLNPAGAANVGLFFVKVGESVQRAK